MQQPNTIALYEERLVSLWARLVRTLGIHTARVLLARAIGQTAQRHPDIALLQHDDGGLTFEVLETRYATRPHEEIEAAFTDLSAELRLATVQPAMILLDMRMPTMDGWAFAQAYERLPELHAPVIVMTAAHDAATRAAEIKAAA